MSNRPSVKDLRRKVVPLVAVAFGMLAMAYAAVPLYDLFCRVTGYAGTTQTADAGSDVILDRTVTVRFDASKTRGMPWDFKPASPPQTLKIGETGLAFYKAHNPTDRTITGSATFNVVPNSVGGYFVKIDCFCFTEQHLAPGATARLPVSFFIDPAILDDRNLDDVGTITLTYTFYRAEPDAPARRQVSQATRE